MDRKPSLFGSLKQGLARVKPYLRWVILGATLIFLLQALKDHWQEVAAIRIGPVGWSCLAIALGITLLAHIISGWVWSWILRDLGQSVSGPWGVLVYLKTNIAKYLPGNIWHFYGRVWASRAAGVPVGPATLSVLMEPLLMAAAALIVALVGSRQANGWLQGLCLVGVLLLLHPRVLNPLLAYVGRLKLKKTQSDETEASPQADPLLLQVKRYPLRPLLGELAFLGLRSAGFALTMVAIQPLQLEQLPAVASAFSLAWLLGLVVPGAPGGIGVFEVTAIALLNRDFAAGAVLSAVALYRLISTLAEAGGAGLAWLDERQSLTPGKADRLSSEPADV